MPTCLRVPPPPPRTDTNKSALYPRFLPPPSRHTIDTRAKALETELATVKAELQDIKDGQDLGELDTLEAAKVEIYRLRSLVRVRGRKEGGKKEGDVGCVSAKLGVASKVVKTPRANTAAEGGAVKVKDEPTVGSEAAVEKLMTAMSDSEGRAELKALFKKLDTDENGCISAKEWSVGIYKNKEIVRLHPPRPHPSHRQCCSSSHARQKCSVPNAFAPLHPLPRLPYPPRRAPLVRRASR